MTCKDAVNCIVESSIKEITSSETSNYKETLTTLAFEDSSQLVTISESSFYSFKKLQNVDFSNCKKLETIKEDAFAYCSLLSSVVFPSDGVLATLEGGSFMSTNITHITFPSSLTTLIWHQKRGNCGAFSYCPLEAVSYYTDNCLSVVGAYSFLNTKLTEFEVGSKVTSIAGPAFELPWKGFTKITVKEDNPTYSVYNDMLYRGNTLVFCPPGVKNLSLKETTDVIGSEALMCGLFTDISFMPSQVYKLEGWSFNGCSKLKNVVVPFSIISIGQCAFYNCQKLVSFVFSPGVIEISKCIFQNDYSLSSVIIKDGTTKINAKAFAGCKQLKKIVIPDSVSSIAAEAFSYCSITCGIICTELEKKVIIEATGINESLFRFCPVPLKTFSSCNNRKLVVFISLIILILTTC